jgi:hypothetical protein
MTKMNSGNQRKEEKYNNSRPLSPEKNNSYPNYIEDLISNIKQNSQTNDSFHASYNNINSPSYLIEKLQNNSNIHDANPSYLLQKQMNSSRFGGFRTADGASNG